MRGRLPASFNALQGSGEEQGLEGLLIPDGILVGQGLALEIDAKPKTVLALEVGGQRHFGPVTSVMRRHSGPPSVWDRLAVMDIAAAQRTFGLTGRLDRIDVVTQSSFSIEQVAQAIQRILPPAVTVHRPLQRSRQVESMVGAFQLNLSVLSMVGLLIGVFFIYNTMSFTVTQRRREVGILRAIGMSEFMVVGLFLAEAGLVGFVGGIVGGGLGELVMGNALVGVVGRTIHGPIRTDGRHVERIWISPGIQAALARGFGDRQWGVRARGAGTELDVGRTIVVAALAPGDTMLHGGCAVPLAMAGRILVVALACAFAEPVGNPDLGYLRKCSASS